MTLVRRIAATVVFLASLVLAASAGAQETPSATATTTVTPASATVALPAGIVLRPTASPRGIEELLAEDFRLRRGLRSELRPSRRNPEDLLLHVGFEVEGAPPLLLVVDATPSAKDPASGVVTETVVKVETFLRLGVHAQHPARLKALEAINALAGSAWAPHRLFLDGDGDLIVSSSVNLPGADAPVPADVVFDLVSRTLLGWRRIYEHLRASGLPVPPLQPKGPPAAAPGPR